MIAVIFEVTPKDGQKGHYLDIAATMRPMVEQVEGFISVERFQSLTNPEKLLSISFFEDEAAIDRWRNTSRPPVGPIQITRRNICRLPPAHLPCDPRLRHV